ncbi:MAG: hypothetical protein SFV54_23430 [Bryobacteraceae bacterium]|nr:hypothetical protein [Bryobacteraceae bacterium]
MPFGSPFPRTFSAGSILNLAPAVPGIYGLSNSQQWILIGRASNIRDALLEHLSDATGIVNRLAATGFVFEECDASLQAARQDRLVLEYEPVGNRMLQ